MHQITLCIVRFTQPLREHHGLSNNHLVTPGVVREWYAQQARGGGLTPLYIYMYIYLYLYMQCIEREWVRYDRRPHLIHGCNVSVCLLACIHPWWRFLQDLDCPCLNPLTGLLACMPVNGTCIHFDCWDSITTCPWARPRRPCMPINAPNSRFALVPAILVTALNPTTWTSLIAFPDIYIERERELVD